MYVHGTLMALFLASAAIAQVIPQFYQPHRMTGTAFGHPSRNATYDYVVVGGGLAGAVVAARLIEARLGTVAVIEAGSFSEISNGNWSNLPYFNTKYVSGEYDDWQPLIDWGLETVPQRNGKPIHYAQGRVLGGSSVRNQMLYHRPTVGAYQKWADQVGDQNYTWDNYVQYFKKSVQFTTDNFDARAPNASVKYDPEDYSMNGGPLHVAYAPYAQPISSYGAEAFRAIGIEPTESLVGGSLNGSAYWPYTLDSTNNNVRSSSENSFLSQAFMSSNLTVYVNAQAMNLIIDANKTVTGVNVTTMRIQPYVVSARKEVIVSAGAYHSPQLLMVSGIGPSATLQKFGIPVVSALEGVGQEMWDTHTIATSSYDTTVPGSAKWSDGEPFYEATAQYLANGTGPMANIGTDYVGWEKIPREGLSAAAVEHLNTFPSDWPDIEYNIASSAAGLGGTEGGPNNAGVSCVYLSAFKRGNMTIQSASMFDPPVIDPNWLRSDIDMEIAVAAFKRARTVSAALAAVRGPEISPGPDVQTDDQIREYIHQNVRAIHHASAACKMGRSNDSLAVVDVHAKVFGVNRLRVIDSSSLPFTPPGHTQGVTYAHAEKLVDDIIMGY